MIKKVTGSQLKFVSFYSGTFKPTMNVCTVCFSQYIHCPSKEIFIYGLAVALAITKHKTEYLHNCYMFIKLRHFNRPSCDEQWCIVSFRPVSCLIGHRLKVSSVAKIHSAEKMLNKDGNIADGNKKLEQPHISHH
jgi:hypothetical protein